MRLFTMSSNDNKFENKRKLTTKQTPASRKLSWLFPPLVWNVLFILYGNFILTFLWWTCIDVTLGWRSVIKPNRPKCQTSNKNYFNVACNRDSTDMTSIQTELWMETFQYSILDIYTKAVPKNLQYAEGFFFSFFPWIRFLAGWECLWNHCSTPRKPKLMKCINVGWRV